MRGENADESLPHGRLKREMPPMHRCSAAEASLRRAFSRYLSSIHTSSNEAAIAFLPANSAEPSYIKRDLQALEPSASILAVSAGTRVCFGTRMMGHELEQELSTRGDCESLRRAMRLKDRRPLARC